MNIRFFKNWGQTVAFARKIMGIIKYIMPYNLYLAQLSDQ